MNLSFWMSFDPRSTF